VDILTYRPEGRTAVPEQPPRQRFAIILEVLPGAVPAPIRLRSLLKTGLRILGLKCLEIHEVTAPNPAAAPVPAEEPAPPAAARKGPTP
jgi:hypothetical protein